MAILIAAFGGVLSLHAASGLPVAQPIGSFLDGVFPSRIPADSLSPTWATQNALPNLDFAEPVRLVPHPTEAKLFIAEKGGHIYAVDAHSGATAKTLLLDLSAKLQNIEVGAGGISGMVLHPEFGQPGSPNRGYFYVFYRWSPYPGVVVNGVADGYNRLSRFTLPDGASAADPNSEYILIQQFDRALGHPGGDMFFDTAGFLYLTLGEEAVGDKTQDTQRIDVGLFSGLLRIDVDRKLSRSHPVRRQPQPTSPPPPGWPLSFTQGYFIPNDNPFVAADGSVLEEFYAIGFRHPWTGQRDAETGEIWVADVGQWEREEVNLISMGGNYQWAYKEGTLPGPLPEPASLIGTPYPPLWEYDHNTGLAIIGAGVYRGDLYPELQGKYLFSDFISGRLWALSRDALGVPAVSQIGTVPGGYSSGINSYAMDPQGRILLAKTAGGLAPGGSVHELVPAAPTPQPPTLLSSTGAFANLATLDVRSGCIPYDVNVPFWSDGIVKDRWLCVPNDGTPDTPAEQISFSKEGDWGFPVGSVLIKHLDAPMDDLDPSVKRRLETRFLVHGEDGYYAFTYKWFADGSDAQLMFDSEDEALQIRSANGTRTQIWHYPSRAECMQCHNANAGGVLGPNTRQLNRDYHYSGTGITANQLETLSHTRLLSQVLNPAEIPSYFKATPTHDANASLEMRARSYIDSNCSYCHRPGGTMANFDARLTTPLTAQNLLYGPVNESLGIPGESVIVPGSLTQSVMYLRASTTDSIAMPPLGKNRVDDAGVAVLAEWIAALGNGNQSPVITDPGAQSSLVGSPVQLAIHALDPEGDALTYSALGLPPGLAIDGQSGVISGTPPPGSAGEYTVTVMASDGIISDSATISWGIAIPVTNAFLETVVVDNVSSADWTTVTLGNSYTAMVAVCTVMYANNTLPEVVRMRSVGVNSFQIRLQNPSGGALNGERVHCLAMEAGTWRLPDGRAIEAHRLLSTSTDRPGAWAGVSQAYSHAYANPVVFGQVMTYNDGRWSSFWTRGVSRLEPPSGSVLYVGKHIGEDADVNRNPELLGYIVVEAGNGVLNGSPYSVALGPDGVLGVTQPSGHFYSFAQPFTALPQTAILTQAAMDNADGSWAMLFGDLSAAGVRLACDQDQLKDVERIGSGEQVAYFVSQTLINIPLAPP